MNSWVTTFETLKFELGAWGGGKCLLGKQFVAKDGYNPDMKYVQIFSLPYIYYWLLTFKPNLEIWRFLLFLFPFASKASKITSFSCGNGVDGGWLQGSFFFFLGGVFVYSQSGHHAY